MIMHAVENESLVARSRPTSCIEQIVTWCGRQVGRLESPLPTENKWVELLIRIAIIFSVIIPLIGLFASLPLKPLPEKTIIEERIVELPKRLIIPEPTLEEMVLVKEEQLPPVQAPASPLKENVIVMEDLYDEILEDLKKLYQPEGDLLYEMVQAAEKKYSEQIQRALKSEETEETKLLTRLAFVRDNFLFLRSLRFSLFMGFTGIGEGLAIQVPRDGNCLYHATLDKLIALRLADPRTTHQNLRTHAVNWLEEHQNEPDVKSQLLHSLNSYKVEQAEQKKLDRVSYINLLQDSSEETLRNSQILATTVRLDAIDQQLQIINAITVADYLKLARQDQFFGASAEIHAISMLYGVTICVKFRAKNQKVDIEQVFNPDQERQITLLYQEDQSHFDLQAIS